MTDEHRLTRARRRALQRMNQPTRSHRVVPDHGAERARIRRALVMLALVMLAAVAVAVKVVAG